MTGFERDLESELHRLLDPMTAGPVPPRRVVTRSGAGWRRLLGGAGVALGAKVATGCAVAAVAATAAAAATEVATTGSLSPADWGQNVRQQVATCKAELAEGQNGIGACVSTFAKQHGPAASSSNQASAVRHKEHGGEPVDAAAKPKDNNDGSADGGAKDNGNKNHDDSSGKDKKPGPGTSYNPPPTDQPKVTHIWLPPPPP